MKRVKVEFGQNNCYKLSGPTPLTEKILTDGGSIEADVGEGQVLLLKPQTTDESPEYTKNQAQNRARGAARR